jgi:hypothetical protein
VTAATNSNALYNSCNSIGAASIAAPANSEGEYQNLNALRRSLETCCQILQQQKQQQFAHNQLPSSSFVTNSEDSPINIELAKKFEGLRSSYIGSNTTSNVSSLANLGTPDSPPQATSPTQEVRELLEQIRQLQNISAANSTSEGIVVLNPSQPPAQPSPTQTSNMPMRRPSSLINKKKFFAKTPSQPSSSSNNKVMYIPIMSNQSSMVKSLKSPSTSNSFLNRGRGKYNWMSKSAPTTPHTGLPPNFVGDDSPLLLDEHDEDAEQNM